MDHQSYTTGDNFTQSSLNRRPARTISLNVTFRFGDLKSSIKRVQRGISNEDIKTGESESESQGVPQQGEGI
jgi:hypothetical protein